MNRLTGHDYRIALPGDWRIDDSRAPAVCRGPTGEEVIVSAARVEGEGVASDRPGLLARLFANAKVAMQKAATQPGLHEVSPLSEHTRSDGSFVAECFSASTDGNTMFAQFALARRATVVLVTHEYPKTASSADSIRDAVLQLEWR